MVKIRKTYRRHGKRHKQSSTRRRVGGDASINNANLEQHVNSGIAVADSHYTDALNTTTTPKPRSFLSRSSDLFAPHIAKVQQHVTNNVSKSIDEAHKQAQKHVALITNEAKKQTEKNAIDAIDVAGHHINKGISLGKYAYNKQKYSNPYSFTASKVAEHAVSPFVKSVSKKMGPSTSDSMKSAVHGMFNTEGIRPNQVSLAAERSSRGVPQSEKTPIVVQSTMSSSV
tara:strand:+ start:666 stop:1349 length:684 start_codon:yes stop_codon:yes gene_type:complete